MSLTTLEEIKDFMQISGTATDALITSYRDIIESEIEAYVNTNLREDSYIETLNYEQSQVDASGFLQYNTRPIRSKLFLKNSYVTTFTLVQDTTTVSTNDYRLYDTAGYIELYSYRDDSEETLKGHYTAGFTTVTAPTDIKSVVYQGVSQLYQSNTPAKQGAGNVKSKKVKNFSVTYGNNASSYIAEVGDALTKSYLEANKIILSKYKKIYA